MSVTVRVRVLAKDHPHYQRVGSVRLEDFERAARRRLKGKFFVTFPDGSSQAFFREVEVVTIIDGHDLDSPDVGRTEGDPHPKQR